MMQGTSTVKHFMYRRTYWCYDIVICVLNVLSVHWRSKATTSGGGGSYVSFHILPTNSILLVNLPTIFNKFTDRTRSFSHFFCYTLVLPTNLPRLGRVAPPTPPATYALVGVMDVIGVMIVVCILNAGPSLER